MWCMKNILKCVWRIFGFFLVLLGFTSKCQSGNPGFCCLHYQGRSRYNCNSAFLPDYMASCCRRMQSWVHCFVALLFPLVVKDQFHCVNTTSCSHARGLGIEPVIQGPYVVCECSLSLSTVTSVCMLAIVWFLLIWQIGQQEVASDSLQLNLWQCSNERCVALVSWCYSTVGHSNHMGEGASAENLILFFFNEK